VPTFDITEDFSLDFLQQHLIGNEWREIVPIQSRVFDHWFRYPCGHCSWYVRYNDAAAYSSANIGFLASHNGAVRKIANISIF
jgi:hypothetical protein